MIERDEWLYVWTDSAAAARRFFGVPPDTECRLAATDGDGNQCWEVKADVIESVYPNQVR